MATTMRMLIRKWSWLQYAGMRRQLSFLPDLHSFLSVLIWPGVSCSLVHVLHQRCQQSWPEFPGRDGTARGSRVSFYSFLWTQRLWRQLFHYSSLFFVFCFFFPWESLKCKQEITDLQILVVRLGRSDIPHLGPYLYIYQRVKTQVFFIIIINNSVLLKSLPLTLNVGSWARGRAAGTRPQAAPSSHHSYSSTEWHATTVQVKREIKKITARMRI